MAASRSAARRAGFCRIRISSVDTTSSVVLHSNHYRQSTTEEALHASDVLPAAPSTARAATRQAASDAPPPARAPATGEPVTPPTGRPHVRKLVYYVGATID